MFATVGLSVVIAAFFPGSLCLLSRFEPEDPLPFRPDIGFVRVKQIWSEMHESRQESLALAIFGIVLTGQAVMQQVAEILYERLSTPCKVTSYECWLQRLIDN